MHVDVEWEKALPKTVEEEEFQMIIRPANLINGLERVHNRSAWGQDLAPRGKSIAQDHHDRGRERSRLAETTITGVYSRCSPSAFSCS